MTAARCTLWWTRLYTRGLDRTMRLERVAEIESDLWEHGQADGRGLVTQAAIVSRLVRGVPADLSWRCARRRPAPTSMIVLRGLGVAIWCVAYLLLVATHAWAATPFLGLELYGADWEDGVWAYATVGLVMLLLILSGTVGLLRGRPRLGAATTAAGALGTSLVFPWGVVVYGPAGVIVTLGLARHVRRRARRPQAASSAAS